MTVINECAGFLRMKKMVLLVLAFLVSACAGASELPSIPGVVTITSEVPRVEVTMYPAQAATRALTTATRTPVSPTVTRTPSPVPWRVLPQATITPPGPTPTETLLPLLELPTERPFAPSRLAWTGLPTYPADSEPGLLFRVDYDPDVWALTQDNFGSLVLAHRQIPYCVLLPWSGRGLPAGLQVEHEFRTIGGAAFDVHTIARNGVLEFIAYAGGDQKIVTGFQVAFEEQKEQCIEDAEAVLATLRSTPSP